MKKLLILCLALFLYSCGSIDKILNAGMVSATNYNEVIPFNYDNGFALIDVEINKKVYKFLVDTGAPTCISSEIFKDLNIEQVDYVVVEDSQGQINSQEVAVVPEIKIGSLTYNNIGVIVANLRDVFEYDCMGIDGIIGANQMAKSYWKFDYRNKKINITDLLSNFDLTTYKDTLSFAVSGQKTPYVQGHVNGIKALFNFDTGFRGNMDVDRDLADFKEAKGYTKYGSSGIGLFGAVDSTSIRTIKVDSLRIGNIKMGAQVVDLDHGNLLGNEFMNKHDMVMDWSNQKIYLKKIETFEKTQESSFGFGFRVKENKLIVASLIKEFPIGLQLGDQILSVNDQDFSDLNDATSCDTFLNYTLKDADLIEVTYLRDGKQLTTQFKKVSLID